MTASPYPYENDNPYDPQWTDKAYDLVMSGDIQAVIEVSQTGATEVVSGPCPRCDEKFTHTAPRSAVAGAGVLGNKGPELLRSEYAPVELYCECPGPHGGRPTDKQGCGIAYTVPARITST